MSRQRFTLSTGWQWRLASSNGSSNADSIEGLDRWTPCAHSPSVIHMELLTAGHIPDPNIGENERLVQWVADADWEYSCTFPTPKKATPHEHLELFFEGLDTFAIVLLNGHELAKVDNMFIPLRVDVKSKLREVGSNNELNIIFESPLKAAAALEQKHGKRMEVIRNPKRMHTRKAQYHYGWDWGPILTTSGPYMPIHLEAFNSRIGNVLIDTKVDVSEDSAAQVSLTVNLAPPSTRPSKVTVHLLDSSGKDVAKATSELRDSSVTVLETSIANPKLWWPNGHGAQDLYKARTTVLDAQDRVLDEKVDQFGLRNIKLMQRSLDDEPGKTFMFNVNGRDIFCQGADWIPADTMLPSISRERHFAWIRLAQRCNFNMIRVWGGGIYETEDFMDACDEMGMLVWHDYAFACGDYPIHDDFLASIRTEAEFQTLRLRNRASLALLCGGNEDFMILDLMLNIKYDHSDLEGPFDDATFPQRKIYLDVLPKVAAAHAPSVPYWCNSPWGGETANDLTVGDVHQWDVWHGKQASYQKYGELSGRFVSEFGMHGYPDMRTVELFVEDASDRHPQSRATDCHNKGHGQETRIARYLAENFRYSMRLEDLVYCSQLLQSEACGYALRDWKRKFNGPGKEACAGAVIWQLNDVYPATSWAFIDYYLRPKPAFYTIRRSCLPISIGIERRPRTRWIDEDHPPKTQIESFYFFGHNTTTTPTRLRLELTGYDMRTQSYIPFPEHKAKVDVTLEAGRNSELHSLVYQGGGPPEVEAEMEKSLVVLYAKLVDPASGVTVARIVDWPEPFRYLTWAPDTQVKTRVVGSSDPAWKKQVEVSANRPVKGCFVSATAGSGNEDPEWEDNMVDLMPGEELSLRVNGLGDREIGVRFLGDWEL